MCRPLHFHYVCWSFIRWCSFWSDGQIVSVFICISAKRAEDLPLVLNTFFYFGLCGISRSFSLPNEIRNNKSPEIDVFVHLKLSFAIPTEIFVLVHRVNFTWITKFHFWGHAFRQRLSKRTLIFRQRLSKRKSPDEDQWYFHVFAVQTRIIKAPLANWGFLSRPSYPITNT